MNMSFPDLLHLKYRFGVHISTLSLMHVCGVVMWTKLVRIYHHENPAHLVQHESSIYTYKERMT